MLTMCGCRRARIFKIGIPRLKRVLDNAPIHRRYLKHR